MSPSGVATEVYFFLIFLFSLLMNFLPAFGSTAPLVCLMGVLIACCILYIHTCRVHADEIYLWQTKLGNHWAPYDVIENQPITQRDSL